MRLSTFNIENLFDRARAMNLDTWEEGKPVLEDFTNLNKLIQEQAYSDLIKLELLKIMKRYKGLLTTGESKFIRLRGIRGDFLKKSGNKFEVIAGGRNDWIGWFELETEPVTAASTENIAHIMDLIKPDVLCIVEAEDRTGLKRFNQDVMRKVSAKPFDHVMLIDGEDERGIDVGIMTGQRFEIVRMLSHVDDTDEKGRIFSRDCAEYEIKTRDGNTLLLLVNHFKSKGYGGSAASAAKRLRQAKRVRAIYDGCINRGYEYVAVVGDLNENPAEPAMAPLIRDGSTLTDIMVHQNFVGDGRPGTHGNGAKSSKLDYILMSPKLSAKVIAGGIERRGVWGGKNGTLFPHLPSMAKRMDAASDHAALWVDLEI